MAYTFSISIGLGSTKTGLSLRAQLVNTDNTPSGGEIAAGFAERGEGWYTWNYESMPDDFRGSVDIYDQADPDKVLVNFGVEPLSAGGGASIGEILAGNIDSTGGTLTLAKALEALVARQLGDMSLDGETSTYTFYGRDGQTMIATVKATGNGSRTESTII